MTDQDLVTAALPDYELLDSGDLMKLERFGTAVLARPETQALWKKKRPELWAGANASFSFNGEKRAWEIKRALPEPWELSFGDARIATRLTSFKHTGIFPEQSPNWQWLAGCASSLARPQVLNLFAYTGVASMIAARAGAFVTHVDASKQTLAWAEENAKLSEVGNDAIRWILEDALAFAKREARRGAKYDGIVLDPPAFGRGAKGEVWHIEHDLPNLLSVLATLLKEGPGSFLLVNGYAAGYASRSFAQAVESAFGAVTGEAGELHIQESGSERAVPAGIYARFVR